MAGRAVQVVTITLGVIAAAGCAGDDAAVSARLGYQHPMISLDPHAHSDAVTGAVLSAVYEALVRVDPGWRVEPALAARWSTPDDTVWEFRLRDGAVFHDGSAVTAQAVVESFERALDPERSAVATHLEAVEAVTATGPGTVVVTTVTPFPMLLTRLAQVAITPPGFDPRRPSGTGPYRWVRGDVDGPVRLERFPEYWGDPPAMERLEIRFARGDRGLMEMLGSGEIDVASGVPPDVVSRGGLPPGWSAVRIPAVATTALGLNVRVPPLDDARVREAIDRAIDRDALISGVLPAGSAEVASTLVPAEVFGFGGARSSAGPDPGRARLLIEQAGATGRHLELAYSAVDERTAAAVAQWLGGIGLEVTPRRRPYEEFYGALVAGELELFLFGWNFRFADAADLLEAIVHSRDPGSSLGRLNGSGYSNPEADRWIEAAAREPRSTQRLELLRRVLTRVAHDRPYLPLYFHGRFGAVREPFALSIQPGTWVLPQQVRLGDRK